MIKKYFFGIVLLILFSSSSFGQNKHRKVIVLPVPTIGYSPETGTYFGAVSLFSLDFYNDSTTRSSNAEIELTYTLRKQLILEGSWNYFFKDEKWFTTGLLHFSRYPDLYYGIGNTDKSDAEIKFNSKRLKTDVSLFRNLGDHLFIGSRIKYLSYNDIEIPADLYTYNELKNSNSIGAGITLFKDTRNHILTATNGLYALVNATYNFSKTNYTELKTDLRYYKTIGNKTVWATRFLNEFTFGTPPFFDYRPLGGDQTARGYYHGKYRDKHLSTLQTEFRFPIYKRLMLATFGGLSNVYSSQNPFNFDKTLYNTGIGLRFLVDQTENTYLRMDYAIGRYGNNGFYISFGESF